MPPPVADRATRARRVEPRESGPPAESSAVGNRALTGRSATEMDSGRLRAVFGTEEETWEDPDRPRMHWRRLPCGCVFAEKYSGDWRVRSKCPVWDSRHEAELSGVYRTLEDVEWDD